MCFAGSDGNKGASLNKVEIAAILAQGSERHRMVVVIRADHGPSST